MCSSPVLPLGRYFPLCWRLLPSLASSAGFCSPCGALSAVVSCFLFVDPSSVISSVLLCSQFLVFVPLFLWVRFFRWFSFVVLFSLVSFGFSSTLGFLLGMGVGNRRIKFLIINYELIS